MVSSERSHGFHLHCLGENSLSDSSRWWIRAIVDSCVIQIHYRLRKFQILMAGKLCEPSIFPHLRTHLDFRLYRVCLLTCAFHHHLQLLWVSKLNHRLQHRLTSFSVCFRRGESAFDLLLRSTCLQAKLCRFSKNSAMSTGWQRGYTGDAQSQASTFPAGGLGSHLVDCS